MPKLILFDVDGTLIDSGRAGVAALNRAVEDLFRISDGFDGIKLAGRTDIQIIREALSNLGVSFTPELLARFLDTYLDYLTETVRNDRGHVKPGVSDLLVRLSEEEEFILGLLTGNIEQGARIKLDRFALNGFFALGAFGSDSEDRNLLLPVAVERLADMTGVSVRFGDCIVIGDTPFDVECSKAHGSRSIAVATGPFSTDRLIETGAELVVEDLSDTDAIFEWLREI